MAESENKNLHLVFMGTGTSQGVPVIACECEVCRSSNNKDKRLRASALLMVEGKNIVIDAGPDFRQQMLRHNVTSLRAILLTHEHVDHIFGLDDIRPFNWIQKQPTDIYAEERVETAIKRIFDYVFAKFRYPGIPKMNLHQIDGDPFFIDDIEVIPVRGFHHKLPVYGFRFGRLAYLTDVSSIPEKEKNKLRGLKILVINALHKEKHISHLNLSEALSLIAELQPEKAYLTHISHQMGLYSQVSKELPANVFLAFDGLEISI